MRINELKTCIGRQFSDLYRCGRIRNSDVANEPMFQNDATGICTTRVQIQPGHGLGFNPGGVVSLNGVVELDGYGDVQVRVRSCVAAATFDVPSLDLLPWPWLHSRARPGFDRLLRLLYRVGAGPVRAFLNRLFADLSIARPYLRVLASSTHHHTDQGGLLIHSVECAEELAQRFLPHPERALGILGALVHDIAEIRILIQPGSPQRAINGVTLGALNLEVLAPYLRGLDREWPSGAAALREMLAPSRNSGSSGWTPLLLTDFIRYIDRLSAGANLREQLFSPLPRFKRCTRTKNGQLLARISPPEPAVGWTDVETVL